MRQPGFVSAFVLGLLLSTSCSSDTSPSETSDAAAGHPGSGGAADGGATGAGGASTGGAAASGAGGASQPMRDAGPEASSGNDASMDGAAEAGTDADVDAAIESGIADATAPDASADAGSDAADAAPPPGCINVAVGTTFHEIYSNLLSVKCIPCHTASKQGTGVMPLLFPPNQAFDQGPQTAYDDLLDEPDGAPAGAPALGYACGSTGERRVVPGDPAHSLLIEKLEGKKADDSAVCGVRMPYMQQKVCQPVIDGIKTWIANGAHDD